MTAGSRAGVLADEQHAIITANLVVARQKHRTLADRYEADGNPALAQLHRQEAAALLGCLESLGRFRPVPARGGPR